MLPISRRNFLELTLSLFIYASIGGCRRPQKQIFGIDHIVKPLVSEDHSEALDHWARMGIRNAVLVNIDTHDDIRWIPSEKISSLQKLYNNNEWDRFRASDSCGDQGLFSLANWIYAGAKLGIFKEVYWIAPFAYFEQNRPLDHLRQHLSNVGFRNDEISAFTFDGKRFHGSFHGIQLTICGLNALPDISEPLLLTVDTDFFPMYASEHRITILDALRDTFDTLYRKKYRLVDSTICYSVNGGYLDIRHRWVGDAIPALFRNPGMIHEKPPEVLAVLQQTENAYLQGDADNILNLIASYKGSQEESPLRLYKTLAQIMQGNPELAYATALSLCSTDHRFSPVFLQIANLLVSGKNQQEAERFFSAGFKLWPEMDLGLVDFALCLRDTGQFHEAISFFNKEIKLRGSFPVEFMVANTYLLLNDQSTFRKSLQSAISGIDRNRYSYVIDQSVADDIYNVIRYCENNGMAREAAILRNNSKLGLMSKLFTENRSPEPAR